MSEASSLKIATSELIAFGIVGTILDGAYDVLIEVDPTMARDLEIIMDRVMVRFGAAETMIFTLDGFHE